LTDPSLAFRPHIHQYDAIIATLAHPVVWLCGGLGSGKTHALVWWIFFMATEWARGKDGLLFEPDFATFDDTFMSVWRAQIPGEGSLWVVKRTDNRRRLIISPAKGVVTTVFVRSAMNRQSVMRSEGLTTIAWAAIDEPARMLCGEQAFKNCVARARVPIPGFNHNPKFIVGTPRGLGHWTAEAFGCTEDHPDIAYTVGYQPDAKNKPGYFIRACETKENVEFLSPNYEAEGRVAMGAALGAQEFAASLMSAQGRILPEFSKAVHVIPHELALKLWAERVTHPFGGLDWGYTAPADVHTMGWTRDKELVVIDEWQRTGQHVQKQGSIMSMHEDAYAKSTGQLGRKQLPWYGDPSNPGKIDTLRMGYNWRGVDYAFGVVPFKATSNTPGKGIWQARLDLLRILMDPRPGVEHPAYPGNAAVTARGAPRYYMSDRCTFAAKEMAAYRQAEQKYGEPAREGAEGEDHGIDAIGGAAYTTATTLKITGYKRPTHARSAA
jgi:hypothetical protein